MSCFYKFQGPLYMLMGIDPDASSCENPDRKWVRHMLIGDLTVSQSLPVLHVACEVNNLFSQYTLQRKNLILQADDLRTGQFESNETFVVTGK